MNELPTTPATDITTTEQDDAKRGIVFLLKQLLANPTSAGYVTKALQWGIGLAGAKVSAVSDDGLYQAAGWIVTAAMAAWAFWCHRARNQHIVVLTQAVAATPALPATAEIKGDNKQGSIPLSLLLAVTLAMGMFIGIFAVGCSTVKADAKAAEHQILVDGHAVGKTLVADGQQFVQLTIDGLDAYRTNADFRASVDKDIANAAVVAAKVP